MHMLVMRLDTAAERVGEVSHRADVRERVQHIRHHIEVHGVDTGRTRGAADTWRGRKRHKDLLV